VRAFVAKIPDGTYEAESFLDNDGRSLDVKLRIKVKVVIAGECMTVDFSEINDQVPGPINSGYSGGLAAARVAVQNLTQPEAGVNEGCFRALELILPEGKILNARWPAALGLWSIPLPTVIDTILKALAGALPERIPAAHKGDMGGCSIGGFRADGRRFLLMNIFGGGWGGRPHEGGESASMSICQGDVGSAPGELQEVQEPLLNGAFALRRGSRRAGPPPRRAGRRAHLQGAAEMRHQRELRAHERSALGPARRQARRRQRGGPNPARRQRAQAAQGDRRADRAGRPPHLPDCRRRRLWRSAHARPKSARRRRRHGPGLVRGGAMLSGDRRRRLAAAMAEAGIDEMVLYGNAWQGDYLRYATDFGILEGHGIALVAADGTVDLFVDSVVEAERAEAEVPDIRVA